MGRIYLFMIAFLLIVPGICFATGTLTLNRSGGFDSQRNTSNATSHYFGVDSQGNTSVLTPNHSRGYIGFDSQRNAVIITPLRGGLGVDSQGNIWTIRPR
jgi:hypothetical protein